MVRVRASLAQLPAHVPGRKRPGAVVLAGDESPYGLPQGVAAPLSEAAGGVSRHPELHATSLVEALAAHHGVEPKNLNNPTSTAVGHRDLLALPATWRG